MQSLVIQLISKFNRMKRLRHLQTSAITIEKGLRVTFPNQGDTTIDITSALETYISSMAACESATLRIIAKKQGFKLGTISWNRIESSYDLNNYWEREGKDNMLGNITVEVQIQTNLEESEKAKLRETTERLCPIYQMISRSGVKVHSEWKFKKIQ